MDSAPHKKLIEYSNRLIKIAKDDFKRYLYREINFDARLIVIKGFRGVGKTTLLLQYLKEKTDLKKSLYLTLDHLFFSSHRLIDTIDDFYGMGYRVFVLDEVHKYKNWSIELKNLYDVYPDVKLLVTASSALDIMSGMADLSRRADVYELKGMSFREFLELEYGIKVAARSFDELLDSHIDLTDDIYGTHDIDRKFKTYLRKGYYPYYKDAGLKYAHRLQAVISQVIETDLPPIFNIDYETTRQLKKLLAVISRIAPFSPNVTKLARDLKMNRNRVLTYIDYLEKSGIINTLKSNSKSDSAMTKPDKIYLENTNIAYAIALPTPNIGALRESYVRNALSVGNYCSTAIKGDVIINNSYTAEIGGRNKGFKQIVDMPNPLLIKDDIEVGGENILPLWTLGVLY